MNSPDLPPPQPLREGGRQGEARGRGAEDLLKRVLSKGLWNLRVTLAGKGVRQALRREAAERPPL